MPRSQQGKKITIDQAIKSSTKDRQKGTKPKEVWEKEITKIKLAGRIPLQRVIPTEHDVNTDCSPYQREKYERHFKRGRDGELEQKSIRAHKKISNRLDILFERSILL